MIPAEKVIEFSEKQFENVKSPTHLAAIIMAWEIHKKENEFDK